VPYGTSDLFTELDRYFARVQFWAGGPQQKSKQEVRMSDREYVETTVAPRAPGWLVGVAIAGLVLALGSLGWALGLQNHLAAAQQSIAASDQRNQALSDKLEQTNDRMKAQGEMLGQSVGLTQKQLEQKSNQLIAAEHAEAATTAKLAKAQNDTNAQVTAVASDVSNVKTDVGGVKTDVATTQADLAQTKTQLGSMKGDEGVMSGLIATNHDQLEELRHRGDRNYYEFTLTKGAAPTLVSTVKLQLKKADQKKSKFTLAVNADDRNIEKKDRNLNEPIQFYSGKTPMLYEIVVNTEDKNQIKGYLSTPKNAPQQISMP
jgi:chromosome segregation ATPase